MNKKRNLLLFALALLLMALPALANETAAEPAENLAPVTENLELETYRGVAVGGNLLAVDPEGDFLEYQIIRAPRRGEVELDLASGAFTYTPGETRRSQDSFTYVAVDAIGNISEEATVRIRIRRQSTAVTYHDMDGHPAHFAAVTLAEKDIFVGEQIGSRHFFAPDAQVTRGDFLAMTMRLVDRELLTDVVRTGFADDVEIAPWLRPYISTAVMDGFVQGIRREDGYFVFNPNAPITTSEASVLLNNALLVADVQSLGYQMGVASVPAWAYQATANLQAANIIPPNSTLVHPSTLSRSEAAEMLLGALHYLEENTDNRSLLSWAR